MLRLRLAVFIVLLSFACAAAYGLTSPIEGPTSPDNVYEERLNQGLRNTEPYSHVLAEQARTNPSEAKSLLGEAERHSPDTPAFYFKRAKNDFPDIFTSMGDFLEGLKAYGRSFFYLFSLSGLLYASLILSLAVTLGIFALIRFPMSVPLLAHDMGERKKLIVLPLLLLPLSLLGPAVFLLGLLFFSGLYTKGLNRAPVYLAFLLLSLCPLLLKTANIFFTAPTPELRAIVEVNEARGNELAIQALKTKEDYASRFSYALALKRTGRLDESISAYRSIPENERDRRVYANLGNAYAAIGDMALAKEAHQKAEGLGGSAALYYSMSQIYRDTFEYSKGDEYFRKASGLDKDAVSRFAAASSRNPNRFVVDETLSRKEMIEAAIKNSGEAIRPASSPLAVSASAVGLFLLFVFLGRSAGQRARRCSRCGEIFCEKCAREPHREDMCPACYISIIKPVEETPKDRVAKLLKLQERQKRSKTAIWLLSFAPPGIAQIYAGRIFDGAVYLWLFSFSIALAAMNPLISTGMGIYSHGWLGTPMVLFAAVLYAASNLSVRRRLRKGWL